MASLHERSSFIHPSVLLASHLDLMRTADMTRGEFAVHWMFVKETVMMTLCEIVKLFNREKKPARNPLISHNFNPQEKDSRFCNEVWR